MTDSQAKLDSAWEWKLLTGPRHHDMSDPSTVTREKKTSQVEWTRLAGTADHRSADWNSGTLPRAVVGKCLGVLQWTVIVDVFPSRVVTYMTRRPNSWLFSDSCAKRSRKRQFTITTATFNWEWPLSVSVSIRNLCMYSGCSRRNVSRLCDSLCQLPRMSHVKSVLSISLCNDHPLQSVHDCPRICWCRFLHSCIGTMRRFQTSTNCQCIP